MKQLGEFLRQEKAAGKAIFPPGPLIFNALNTTPLENVKVVIIGQDPYHGPGQAHGLCSRCSPACRRLLAEHLQGTQPRPNIPIPNNGYLQRWAEQGVLLLNTSLTVEQAKAGSRHAGWQPFTDRVIEVVNERCERLVFLLWGSHAQSKQKLIDPQRHLILKSAHRRRCRPRGFSATVTSAAPTSSRAERQDAYRLVVAGSLKAAVAQLTWRAPLCAPAARGIKARTRRAGKRHTSSVAAWPISRRASSSSGSTARRGTAPAIAAAPAGGDQRHRELQGFGGPQLGDAAGHHAEHQRLVVEGGQPAEQLGGERRGEHHP